VLKDKLDNERRGRISAVHYRGGGIGRTRLVVGCWLVESGRGGGRRGGAAVHRGGVEVGREVPTVPAAPRDARSIRLYEQLRVFVGPLDGADVVGLSFVTTFSAPRSIQISNALSCS
jgi:hypothetical protein